MLGIGVFILYLVMVEEMPSLGGTRGYITFGVLSLMLISMGFLVAGIRHLANMRHDPNFRTHNGNGGYILFSLLWALLSIGSVGSAVYIFLKAVDWSFTLALGTALPFLVFSIIPIAIYTAFAILSKELGT